MRKTDELLRRMTASLMPSPRPKGHMDRTVREGTAVLVVRITACLVALTC